MPVCTDMGGVGRSREDLAFASAIELQPLEVGSDVLCVMLKLGISTETRVIVLLLLYFYRHNHDKTMTALCIVSASVD